LDNLGKYDKMATNTIPLVETSIKSELERAFIVQANEKEPRLQIKRGTESIGFRALEGLTLKDLLDCEMSMLGRDLSLIKRNPNHHINYYFSTWNGARVGKYTQETSAHKIINDIYSLTLALRKPEE